ncbi:uncharacterized protein LOC143317350 isoform X1 [Chaetodon auriga]|uniref:uncharacterized protein LOC143317350 isoform X1 n=1 Tax=Chaetodon auriga TaxID=39042 RepID=UPI004032FB81
MSRIIVVTLLLIILVDNFCHSTDDCFLCVFPLWAASHAEFRVSKVHIRKCRCRVSPDGRIKCRSPLLPSNYVKKQDLIKCFCNKSNQHKFPEFQAACGSWRPNIPITLL